jgi:sterol desaturase/sphingolipid hydroxylase (fatty acid hydroxylase superfamily)
MISLNWIKNFFVVNFILFFIGIIHNVYLLKYNNFSNIYIFFIVRNIFLELILHYSLKDKKYICYSDNYENELMNRQQASKINFSTCIYFLSSTCIETLTYLFIAKYYIFIEQNLIDKIIYFIPISFIYEIIFDIFHYIAHRIEHENSYLYKHIHKIHHTNKYTTILTTYYQHPIDLILSNTIPQIITLMIIPKISFFTFNLITIYKIFTEISGHSGKNINSSCFPQFIYLPRFFNIEMYTEDHDAHHRFFNCNYSKRFILCDKLFNTYKKTFK